MGGGSLTKFSSWCLSGNSSDISVLNSLSSTGISQLVFRGLGHLDVSLFPFAFCLCFCSAFLSFYLIQHLTFNHPTVLLTLSLAVELVAVGLAEVLFVAHTQPDGGVKGPDGWLTCAVYGYHGQTAHSWRHGAIQC